MSKNLMGNIVYLTNAEYDTLITTGTVTLGSGEAITYSENDTYITPEENATTTNAGLMSALDKSKLDNLSTVATTGSYNDLTNKPTIPTDTNQKVKAGTVTFGNNDEVNIVAGSNVTVTGDATNKKITIAATDTTYESKTAASGGTAVSLVTTGEKYTWNNKGTYSKPSGGIPKTDLASTVQTSLGKADTALQSVPSTYRTASAQDTIDSGKESNSNKVTSWSTTTTDAHYPSEKLVKTSLDGKQATISDLATIRSGASAGATAVQPSAISDMATQTWVDHELSNYRTSVQQDTIDDSKANKASNLSGSTRCKITYNSEGIVTGGDNLAASDIPNLSASKITSGTLAVAQGGTGKTTGVDAANYLLNSLSTGTSTPTDNDYYIAQYAGGGTTTTTYHRRPVSALWSYMNDKISAAGYTKNAGTITEVKMNGSSKGTSGVVDLGTVITSHQDISGKENSSNKVTSWSSTTTDTHYPSEKLVKTALDGKADKSTTLSGYGITDAKISSGVITLGSNTITPLTSHQDISGKADKASGLTGATKCKITYNSSGIVTAGADLAATDIPSLAASKITSGTFDAARIPSLNASKITEGTFADARIASASTWNGKYTKPSTGIPASDLASGVIPDISGKQDKLAATGSSTKPIYVSAAGTVSAGNTYAGGTAVTLNGTSKASTTASFYAPTSQLANSDSKVYLVGATSGTSLTTVKSNSEVYMENGYLHSLGLDGNVLTLGGTDTEYLSLYGSSVLINDKPVTTKESKQVILSSTAWNNNQQTVSCEGMSATADAVISPAPSSMSDVISSKIYASAQGSGTITFTCDEVPANNVVFNIMIMS